MRVSSLVTAARCTNLLNVLPGFAETWRRPISAHGKAERATSATVIGCNRATTAANTTWLARTVDKLHRLALNQNGLQRYQWSYLEQTPIGALNSKFKRELVTKALAVALEVNMLSFFALLKQGTRGAPEGAWRRLLVLAALLLLVLVFELLQSVSPEGCRRRRL